MLIGITGLIGSGKSEAARIFKKLGAFVISADKIGRDVVENDKSLLKKLVTTFGPDILSKHGRLKRRGLGELAFSSEKNKKALNAIVHPALLRELSRQVKAARKSNDMVVIDAALLINWGWDKKVDLTILVHATYRNRLFRMVQNGYSESEARMRTKSQLHYSELAKRADIILHNNSGLKTLEKKIKNIVSGFPKRG